MPLCKYCSLPENKQITPFLECKLCKSYVHVSCLVTKKTPGNFIDDVFFEFTCADCSPSRVEILNRDKISWLFVLAIVLNHLSKKCNGISNNGYFHWKTHIGSFIINNWDFLFDSSYKRKKSFGGTFAGILSNWSGVFFDSGINVLKESGWWKISPGFSPALIKYLYTEFTLWKQKDRKNASLVATDKKMEHKILKSILSPIGFDHILKEPIDSKSHQENYKDEVSTENESGPSSPKSEMKSPRVDPTTSDVEDYFSNYLMDCDDSLMITNFDDMLLDFDDCKEEYQNPMKMESPFCANNSSIERLLHNPNILELSKPVANNENENFDTKEGDVKKVKLKYSESDLMPPVKSLFCDSTKSKPAPWNKTDYSKMYSKTESHLITEYTEIQMLNQLNVTCRRSHTNNVDKKLVRLRAKLALRRLKRNRHIPVFNLDNLVCKYAYYPTQDTSSGSNRVLDQFQHTSNTEIASLNYSIRLIASTDPSPFISPYSGKLLKPYIWRDTAACAPWLKLMEEMESKANINNPLWRKKPRASLDYCYVRPHHIASINSLCSQFFWPGIDISDTLLYPEFSCVVLYKKIIVGFAFLVPDVSFNEAYLSFIFTRPEWRKCGIASFMLYHLTQTCIDKDITMHVAASNSAIFLYQKFGFKIEEFLQEFYDKYFPPESKECKHAFFLRLSRS